MTPPPDGIYPNMPAAEYHSVDALSQSGMAHLDPPARWLAYNMADDEEPTPFMRMGTLIHRRILERRPILERVSVRPDFYPAPAYHTEVKSGAIPLGHPLKWRENAKECSAWTAVEKRKGHDILTTADVKTLEGCVAAIEANGDAREFLSAGRGEVSLFQSVPTTWGLVSTKARTDWEAENYILDVKKVGEGKAEPSAFESLLFERGYHRQAAFYLDTYNALAGAEVKTAWLWVVVEDVPPYLVTVARASREIIKRGRADYLDAIDTFARCRASGVWPGYRDGVVLLGLPYRARRNSL